MKRTISVLSISLSLIVGAIAAPPSGPATNAVPVWFSWDAQPGVVNVDWRIYGTLTVATPTNQWPLLFVVTNATLTGTRWNYTNSLVPAAYFFTMTGSNFWSSETFFSVAAASGPSPGTYPNPVQNLTLKLP